MKLRQKIYDSSESINRLIKITNSFHHYNNLKKIKERKPLYIYNNNNNYNKNKSKHNLEINKLYNQNNIIINSIDKIGFNGIIESNKKYGVKNKNNNKITYENNKNYNSSKNKNNKKNLILPPITKFLNKK